MYPVARRRTRFTSCRTRFTLGCTRFTLGCAPFRLLRPFALYYALFSRTVKGGGAQ